MLLHLGSEERPAAQAAGDFYVGVCDVYVALAGLVRITYANAQDPDLGCDLPELDEPASFAGSIAELLRQTTLYLIRSGVRPRANVLHPSREVLGRIRRIMRRNTGHRKSARFVFAHVPRMTVCHATRGVGAIF
jgi:hypothetical protein